MPPNILHWDIASDWDIASRLHQKYVTSATYTSNTICNSKQRTFQVDISMCGEKKYMDGSCIGAAMEVTKSTK